MRHVVCKHTPSCCLTLGVFFFHIKWCRGSAYIADNMLFFPWKQLHNCKQSVQMLRDLGGMLALRRRHGRSHAGRWRGEGTGQNPSLHQTQQKQLCWGWTGVAKWQLSTWCWALCCYLAAERCFENTQRIFASISSASLPCINTLWSLHKYEPMQTPVTRFLMGPPKPSPVQLFAQICF